jgi:hypothetical protein
MVRTEFYFSLRSPKKGNRPGWGRNGLHIKKVMLQFIPEQFEFYIITAHFGCSAGIIGII